MNFKEWQATRTHTEHISDYFDDMAGSGYIYTDENAIPFGFIWDCTPGDKDYCVMISNTEILFAKLEEAEQYLWDNWIEEQM